VLLVTSAFCLQADAELFSQFNRYELSVATLQYTRQTIVDTGYATWFSSQKNKIVPDTTMGFYRRVDGQSIAVTTGALAAFEYAAKASRFGNISTNIDYISPVIKAHISTDIYTTERQAASVLNDIQYERFIKEGAHEPIVGMFDFRGHIPEGYIEANYKTFTLSTGKQKLRWGPGYKGTLGMSGTAYSPFYFYNLNFDFAKLFHAQAFLSGYDDEVTYTKEISTTTKTIVKASNREIRLYEPRYVAGQRIDMRIGKYLQLGMYELVDFFGSNELNRFANPLQMYYLSNEASGTNNANMLAGMDFNLVYNPVRLYGEFINDDITVFEQSGNPDKYAFQVGAAYYGKSPLVVAGVEYTHLTRYIYGHSRVLSRHAHWGESMGWPWGNDMDVVTTYAVLTLPHNINGRVEANYWLKGNGTITDEWYADGSPDLDKVPFFPEHATKVYSMIFSAEYKPEPWLTCAFYYEPVVQHATFRNEFYTYLQCSLPKIGKK